MKKFGENNKPVIIIRVNIKNLMNQSFFEPYPSGLVEGTDSGKGRE